MERGSKLPINSNSSLPKWIFTRQFPSDIVNITKAFKILSFKTKTRHLKFKGVYNSSSSHHLRNQFHAQEFKMKFYSWIALKKVWIFSSQTRNIRAEGHSTNHQFQSPKQFRHRWIWENDQALIKCLDAERGEKKHNRKKIKVIGTYQRAETNSGEE